MNKEFCVCYASSNEYAQYTGISLLSLLENNNEIVDRVYILSFGIEKDNIKKIQNITAMYQIDIVIIDAISKMSQLFSELEMLLFEGSYATYARAFISKIIDDYNGKLLYIDSDTVVDGSILPLRKLDLEKMGKAYAGVIGMNQYIFPYMEIRMKNGNSKYFACGVLLFDMKMWRELRCTETIVNFIKESESKYFLYADQTVINNCISEDLAFSLDLEYNYWGHMFRGKRIIYELTRGGFYSVEHVKKAKKHPVIIHYKGEIVHPWLIGNASSLSDRYHCYKLLSPWKDEKENTIYFSDKEGKETAERRKEMRKTKMYLSYPACVVFMVESLAKLKHKILGKARELR